MAKYTKPFKTYDQQLDILVERGMIVDDRDQAKKDLRRLGYYRLSGYWYPFRIRRGDHREGVDTPESDLHPGYRFSDIVTICDFDSQLRSYLLRAIEALEVSVRAAVAYEAGKRGPFAYLDRSFWGKAAEKASPQDPSRTLYDEFCRRHRMAVTDSKEQFADHFKRMYDGEVPIWAAIELWDFGTLSRFYQIMPENEQLAVSESFGTNSSRTMRNWLLCLNDLRNFCAHHQRLNRRHFPNSPRIPKVEAMRELRHVIEYGGRSEADRDMNLHRLYPLMALMAFMLRENPVGMRWKQDIRSQFTGPFVHGLSLGDYGIPGDWRAQELWGSPD